MICYQDVRCVLGESPLWDEAANCFYWVDIEQKHIHCLLQDKTVRTYEMPEKVACLALSCDGQLVVAMARSLAKVNTINGECQLIITPELDTAEMFNDGNVDSIGRFWIGTKDLKEKEKKGKLYCFDGINFSCCDEGFTVSNGIDWNLDETRMYFTDSPTKTIYCYDFVKETGHIQNRQIFTTVEVGIADGLTVDAEGNVWSAHWDGHRVSCYNSQGKCINVIDIPCTHVTSCCFKGQSNTLFVTSASRDVTLKAGAKDGFLFALEVDKTGRLANRCRF